LAWSISAGGSGEEHVGRMRLLCSLCQSASDAEIDHRIDADGKLTRESFSSSIPTAQRESVHSQSPEPGERRVDLVIRDFEMLSMIPGGEDRRVDGASAFSSPGVARSQLVAPDRFRGVPGRPVMKLEKRDFTFYDCNLFHQAARLTARSARLTAARL